MNLTGFLFKGIRARNKLWFPCYPWYLKTNTAGHAVVFFRKHQPREFFFPLWKEFSFLAHIWCWWFRLFLGLTRVPQSSHFHGSFLIWFAGWCFSGGGQLLLKRKQCWLWFWLHSVHVFSKICHAFLCLCHWLSTYLWWEQSDWAHTKFQGDCQNLPLLTIECLLAPVVFLIQATILESQFYATTFDSGN